MPETLMRKEIFQTPAIIAAQQDCPEIAETADYIKALMPEILLTVARGTSDHAVEYLGYLLMKNCGIPAASIPPSLNSLYSTQWRKVNALTLAISQSGGSPDLVESVKNLNQSGIPSLSLVNTLPSPLSEISNRAINIHAGEEKSVAATKSFIASLSVGLRVLNGLFDDKTLIHALNELPEKLEQSQQQDWGAAVESMQKIERLYIVGRGTGLSIAKEAALKCKETCLIHGEAFSGAEVKHGPMALMNERQVVLIFAPPSKAQAGLIQTAEQFKGMGAKVLLAADNKVKSHDLTLIDAGHESLQGLTTIHSFYTMAEQLSAARGINTDHPPHLNKVTKTH